MKNIFKFLIKIFKKIPNFKLSKLKSISSQFFYILKNLSIILINNKNFKILIKYSLIAKKILHFNLNFKIINYFKTLLFNLKEFYNLFFDSFNLKLILKYISYYDIFSSIVDNTHKYEDLILQYWKVILKLFIFSTIIWYIVHFFQGIFSHYINDEIELINYTPSLAEIINDIKEEFELTFELYFFEYFIETFEYLKEEIYFDLEYKILFLPYAFEIIQFFYDYIFYPFNFIYYGINLYINSFITTNFNLLYYYLSFVFSFTFILNKINLFETNISFIYFIWLNEFITNLSEYYELYINDNITIKTFFLFYIIKKFLIFFILFLIYILKIFYIILKNISITKIFLLYIFYKILINFILKKHIYTYNKFFILEKHKKFKFIFSKKFIKYIYYKVYYFIYIIINWLVFGINFIFNFYLFNFKISKNNNKNLLLFFLFFEKFLFYIQNKNIIIFFIFKYFISFLFYYKNLLDKILFYGFLYIYNSQNLNFFNFITNYSRILFIFTIFYTKNFNFNLEIFNEKFLQKIIYIQRKILIYIKFIYLFKKFKHNQKNILNFFFEIDIIIKYLNAFLFFDNDLDEYQDYNDQFNQTLFFFIISNEISKILKFFNTINIIEKKINNFKITINNKIINFYIKYYKLRDFYKFINNINKITQYHNYPLIIHGFLIYTQFIKLVFLIYPYLKLFINNFNKLINLLSKLEIFNIKLIYFKYRINKPNYIFILFKKYNYLIFKNKYNYLNLKYNLKLIYKEITFFNNYHTLNYKYLENNIIKNENILNNINYLKYILEHIIHIKHLKKTTLIFSYKENLFFLIVFNKFIKFFTFFFFKFTIKTKLLLLNFFNNNFLFFKNIYLFFKLFNYFINLNNLKYNYILQICNFLLFIKLYLIFYYFLLPLLFKFFNFFYFINIYLIFICCVFFFFKFTIKNIINYKFIIFFSFYILTILIANIYIIN
jgi:hypothetical protein